MGIFTLLRALGYDEEHAPGFIDRFVSHFDFLEGQWEKERHLAPDPERGARRDLQAGPPRRAADGRVGQGLLPQRVLREPSLRPAAASVATSSTASSASEVAKLDELFGRAPSSIGSFFQADNDDPNKRGIASDPDDDRRAAPQRGARRDQLHAPPRQAGARLPPRRPGPLRQPPHPQRRRADPEPGAHRPQPHGARRARAHDHPGRRGDHARPRWSTSARSSPRSRSSSAPRSCRSSWTR